MTKHELRAHVLKEIERIGSRFELPDYNISGDEAELLKNLTEIYKNLGPTSHA